MLNPKPLPEQQDHSGPGLSGTKVPSGAFWAWRFLGKQQGEGKKEIENKRETQKPLF